ncbi:hypothetical protein FS837_011305 [Tulasnella sp. UAMH 9824]|nr:hypothetical protein FS837_011305 [Tulasnella sp. UAMH 9824]
MDRPQTFTSIDLKPKRWHGYAVILFILGTLFPPLAVAARFGFGKDFFINLILTLCGYFPGHGHNFYIQNIRNNKNARRTPKWAVRYGLIDDTALKRRAKRRQWAGKYDERLPQSALEGQEFEPGQIPDRPDAERRATNGTNELWNRSEEGFYGQPSASTSDTGGGGRWHYPANFDDAEIAPSPTRGKSKSGKKKDKKDRWARTEDAHAAPPKKKKRSKSSRSSAAGDRWDDNRSYDSGQRDVHDGPEDAVGGLYGPSKTAEPSTEERRRREESEALNHEF